MPVDSLFSSPYPKPTFTLAICPQLSAFNILTSNTLSQAGIHPTWRAAYLPSTMIAITVRSWDRQSVITAYCPLFTHLLIPHHDQYHLASGRFFFGFFFIHLRSTCRGPSDLIPVTTGSTRSSWMETSDGSRGIASSCTCSEERCKVSAFCICDPGIIMSLTGLCQDVRLCSADNQQHL